MRNIEQSVRNTATNVETKVFLSIHYARGLAAALVLSAHVMHKLASNYGWADSTFGNIGVDVFFIISGFVISSSYFSRKKTFPEFIRDRIVRVIPIYWILTSCALIVYLVAPSLVNSSGGETSIFSSYSLVPLGKKLLVQNGWTLSFEMYFYLAFGVSIIVFGQKSYNEVLICTGGILLFGAALGAIFNFGWLVFNSIVLEFIFGIVLFSVRTSVGFGNVKFFLYLGCCFFSYFVFNKSAAGEPRFLALGIPAFFALLAALCLEKWFKAQVLARLSIAFNTLGDISYSLYLIHPFTVALTAIVAKKFGLNAYLALFFMTLVSLVGGFLTWSLVELPVTNYVRKRLGVIYSKK